MIPAGIVSAASILGAVGGAVRDWVPSDLAGLEFWIDAADTATITETGGSVSQIDDKSGNSRHAVQDTASLQPQTGGSLNGQPAMQFSHNDFIRFSGVPTDNDLSFCCVCRHEDSSNASLIGTDSAYGFNYLPLATASGSDTGISFVEGAYNSDVEYFFGGDDVDNNLYQLDILTGLQTRHLIIIGVPISAGLDAPEFYLGRGTSSSYDLNGPIAEVFIYSGTMSLVDKQKLQGYSAWKHNWVADLPAGHPYKSAAPTVAI